MRRTAALWLACAVVCLPFAGGADVLPLEELSGYTFDYAISWNGLPAAHARATLTSDGVVGVQTHVLETEAWTLPLLRLLWPARLRVQARVAADFSPQRFFVHRRERWREQSAELTFDHEAQVVRVVRRKPSGRVIERTFPLEDLRDPVSLFFSLRNEPTVIGAEREARILVSDTVYVATLVATKRRTLRVGGRPLPAVCIVPKAERINKKGEREPVSKVRGIRMWVTDDALRLPIRVTAAAFIGRVTVVLRRVTPSLDTLYAKLDSDKDMPVAAVASAAPDRM